MEGALKFFSFSGYPGREASPRRCDRCEACLLYTSLGLCGLPVYAGFSSGAGVLFGLTGGFLFIFPVMAWVTSVSCRRFRGIIPLALGLLLSLLLCYGACLLYTSGR